ncbi:MAG TPA: DUF5829 family protein [Steroidobacteraceae bacterium]|nr:DUF5829 family protein [Steroidobacteraceae bacterium]
MKRLLAASVLLLFITSAYSAGSLPSVYLSHFSVVLDKATYTALRTSAQLESLADCELVHTQEGSGDYTGFYVRGRQTYMEFFGDPVPEGEHLGHVGLGLTVEQAGGAAIIAAHLRAIFGGKVKIHSATRPVGGHAVPWYTATYIDADDDSAMLFGWVSETDPEYLAAQHPNSPIDHPLSRKQYLAWDFKPDRLLDDVVGLTLALEASELAQLAKELQAIGWTVKREDSGFAAIGPDVKITVVPAVKKGGLQRIDLRLIKQVPKQEIIFGNAKLIVEGSSGRFTFPVVK